MAELLEAAHRRVLLGGVGVPHEVEALAHGVGVVDAVVAEHPALVHVPARQHGDVADDRVEALALEQGAVGGVVGHDEQAGDDQGGQQLERDDDQRVGEGDQAGDDEPGR